MKEVLGLNWLELWAITLIVISATVCVVCHVIPGDILPPIYTAVLGYGAKGVRESI